MSTQVNRENNGFPGRVGSEGDMKEVESRWRLRESKEGQEPSVDLFSLTTVVPGRSGWPKFRTKRETLLKLYFVQRNEETRTQRSRHFTPMIKYPNLTTNSHAGNMVTTYTELEGLQTFPCGIKSDIVHFHYSFVSNILSWLRPVTPYLPLRNSI